jgi:hypothetical protein
LTFSPFFNIIVSQAGRGTIVSIKHSLLHHIFFVSLSLFFVMPVLLPCCLWAADALPYTENTLQREAAETAFTVRGSFSTKYVYRTTEFSGARANDGDFFEQLRLDVTAPKKKDYEIHFLGAARESLGNDQDQSGFSPFEDISDTYSSKVAGYIYDAHLDINNLLSYLPQVRIGRQAGTRDEPVFFDGIAADVVVGQRLNLTVYGGAAVHFYELNNSWGSDTLAGAGIDYSLFNSTMLSFDYLDVHDERDPFLGADQHDQQSSIAVRQRFTPFLRAMAKYRYLNSVPRDIKVRVIQAFPEADLELSLSSFKQFRTQNELSNEFSSYFDVLGQSVPFQSYDVKVRKMFGRHYALDVGYFQRSLVTAQEENAFNRDYKRAFSVFEMADLLYDGLSFALTGDYWDAKERKSTSAGFDVEYTFKNKMKKAKIGMGTYYSLYKYDYYVQLGERQKVRTYYLNGTVPLTKGLFVTAKYEYEQSIEDYQTFKVGMRYDF